MALVYIGDVDKTELLYELWTQVRRQSSTELRDLTNDDLKYLIQQRKNIVRIFGVPFNVNLFTEFVDATLYDQHYGNNMFVNAVQAVRSQLY